MTNFDSLIYINKTLIWLATETVLLSPTLSVLETVFDLLSFWRDRDSKNEGRARIKRTNGEKKNFLSVLFPDCPVPELLLNR